jgi:hypothetical protein
MADGLASGSPIAGLGLGGFKSFAKLSGSSFNLLIS